MIDLAGTAEVQTFAGPTAAQMVAENNHGSTAYKVTIDGTDYAITGVAAHTTQGLVDRLQLMTDSAVSAFTWASSGDGVITATADAAGYQPNGISITLVGTAVTATSTLTTNGGYGVEEVDAALAAIASDRAALGATQAQLESTVRNLANVAENTAAAAGRIMDTDYAAETANLTKAQILQQAATSILAQANAQPQAVLSLLQ